MGLVDRQILSIKGVKKQKARKGNDMFYICPWRLGIYSKKDEECEGFNLIRSD
jgi:hypothetical protein